MKLQRLFLFAAVPAFIFSLASTKFIKADDVIALDETETSAEATSTIVVNPPLPAPVDIYFNVEGPDSTLFNYSHVSVPPCATPDNASSTLNGFCAFAAAGINTNTTWQPYGALVNSINGISGDSNNFWLWFLNGNPGPEGISQYILKPDDNILWTLGREPLKVNFSTTAPTVNATTTITVLGFDPVKFDFEPVAGASIAGALATTSIDGTAGILATSTNPFTVSVTASGFIPSGQFTITPKPEQIKLTIRNGTTTIFSNNLILPDKSAPDIFITPTNSTASIAVSPRSVLGILKSLEASSTSFSITDLSYSSTYKSFLLNCLATAEHSSAPDCYNWTDAINNVYPQTGIDQQLLNNGDTVYLFFGSPQKTTLSASQITLGQSFIATAQQYDLSSGAYKPLPGVTLGFGTSNPDFSFTEQATEISDTNGQATFTANATGTFSVGIKEDYYFPAASITVTDEATSSATTTSQTGGGSSQEITHSVLNIPNALTFILGDQDLDGSFGAPYLTDWTAIAFSAAGPSANAKAKLSNYLLNNASGLYSVTDYERRAMALEALNINPYSGTSVNYITPIIDAFDGTQIGIPSDNDDIFALLPLKHAGFTPNDLIIQKETAYILSTQMADGSWDESPDMTAAALQALNSVSEISGVSSAISKAGKYLISKQDRAGGWGNPDSTSWVQTAINNLIETHSSEFGTASAWASLSGLFPTDILAAAQMSDGGINVPSNRAWSTGYAIVAASGKSWLTILNSFSKPAILGSAENGTTGEVFGTSTTNTLMILNKATTTKDVMATPPSVTPQQAAVSISPAAATAAPATTKQAILPKNKIKQTLQTTQKDTPVLATPQIQTTTTKAADKTGFFGKVWRAIVSFFRRLF